MRIHLLIKRCMKMIKASQQIINLLYGFNSLCSKDLILSDFDFRNGVKTK